MVLPDPLLWFACFLTIYGLFCLVILLWNLGKWIGVRFAHSRNRRAAPPATVHPSRDDVD